MVEPDTSNRLPVVETTAAQKLHQGTIRKTGVFVFRRPPPFDWHHPGGRTMFSMAGILVTFFAKINKEKIV